VIRVTPRLDNRLTDSGECVRIGHVIIIVIIIIIIIIVILHPFVWCRPRFQFLDPIQSRYDFLERGTDHRKAWTCTEGNSV
jgi:hypothetical protein